MGLVLLWKDKGPSSQHVLGDYKNLLKLPGKGRRGIGHNGTLDPFAEGLLCVGYGEGRKLLHPLEGMDKTYVAELVLGAPSESFDSTGNCDFSKVSGLKDKFEALNPTILEQFLKSKLGDFDQIPPLFSAKHIDGKRAYEWARQGVEKKLKAKRVKLIHAKHLDLFSEKVENEREVWIWRFEVRVSAGTYIRAFARDWSLELVGESGHLRALKRTAIGPFSAKQEACPLKLHLDHLETLFEIRQIDPQTEHYVRNGREYRGEASDKPQILISEQGTAMAWCEAQSSKIKKVFLEDPFKA